jgi:hypothetical protein
MIHTEPYAFSGSYSHASKAHLGDDPTIGKFIDTGAFGKQIWEERHTLDCDKHDR